MKQVIGYLFTENALRDFEKRGFSLVEVQPLSEAGCRVFVVPVDGEIQLGFHLVSDEEAYCKKFQVEHFFPRLIEASRIPAELQKNTVTAVRGIISKNNCFENPWFNYFRIRKPGEIWALHLNCQDMKEFCRIAQPDRIGSWSGKLAALIQMGPTCFDLVVTQA